MADYVLKKIPELDPTLSIVDTDLLVVETSDGTKSVAFANLKSSIPNYGYLSAVFTSLALSGNILTINHAKNTRKIRLTIFNPAGISTPLPWYIVDANNVAINFGGTIEAGDWEYLLEFWTGEGTGSYPDPIYEPAILKEDVTLIYDSISPDIILKNFQIKRFNNLVLGHIEISFKSSYVINNWRNVGQLNISGANVQMLFPGSHYLTNVYESCALLLDTNGSIQARSGYKPLNQCHFNISFFTTEP